MTFTLKVTWIKCFYSAFVANVATFLSNSVLFMNLAISDLSTKYLLFMLLSTIYLPFLSYSALVIYLDPMFDILAS